MLLVLNGCLEPKSTQMVLLINTRPDLQRRGMLKYFGVHFSKTFAHAAHLDMISPCFGSTKMLEGGSTRCEVYLSQWLFVGGDIC